MEFVPYPKTPRLKRSVVITEKIDGTNAQVVISKVNHEDVVDTTNVVAAQADGYDMLHMRVGSRNRWIIPGRDTDNFGFAGWCRDNADELFKLGEGQHFGEWYGQGIGRGYGLTERRFALFNTERWGSHNPGTPKCCEVVPVLYVGDMRGVDSSVLDLTLLGSSAVPGFREPEGVIVYHSAARQVFKVLLENDEGHKGTE